MLTKVWKSIGIILICGLTACWPKKEDKLTESQKNAVPEKVILHIASDFNYFPFAHKDPKETDAANPNDNKKGLEVDIITELAKRLDFQIVFEELKFEEIIDAVSSGRVDGAIGGISITTNRKEKVLFTAPFYKSPVVSVVSVENTANPGKEDQEFDLFVVSDPDFTDFVGKQLSEKYKKLTVSNFPLWEDVLQSFETKNIFSKKVAIENLGKKHIPVKLTRVTRESPANTIFFIKPLKSSEKKGNASLYYRNF